MVRPPLSFLGVSPRMHRGFTTPHRRAAFPNAAAKMIKTTTKSTFSAVGAIINRPQKLMQFYDITRRAAFPNAAEKINAKLTLNVIARQCAHCRGNPLALVMPDAKCLILN